MSVFRAAMRHGAPILFGIALVVFVVTLAAQFMLSEQLTGQQHPTDPTDSSAKLVFIVNAFVSALSNSAYLFLGACLVDRADRFLSKKGVSA